MFFLFHSLPVLASPWLLRCSCSAHAFQVFPLLSGLVSRAIFPVLCTRLSVCFLSSFPVSLPQLFHRCLPGDLPLSVPFALAFSPSFPLPFVRFFSGSDYSVIRFFLSLFPVSPHGGSSGSFSAFFPLFRTSLPASSVLSFPAFPFSASLFRTTGATFSCRPPVSSSAVPLSFRLRFRLLGKVIHLEN